MLERKCLDLEAGRSPASTSLLELSALGDNTGLDTIVSVRVGDGGAVTEVSDGLTGVLGATKKDSVGALGGAQGKLIKGDAFTAGLDDSGSGSLGESKGSHSHGGNLQKTRIVSDGANNDGSLAFLALHVSGHTRNGNRGAVDLGHSQSLHHGKGELRFGTSGKETV